MSLQPPLLYQGPGAQPLAVMLADLEGYLRSSCKAHTRACHQACGVMQVGQQPLWTPRGPAPAPAILTHTMALLPPLLPPPLLLPPLLPPPLFPPPLLPALLLSLPLLPPPLFPPPLLSLPRQLPPMSQRTLLPLRLCLQADKWVASFPVMSIQLVDSVVWTQSVTAALTRASSGERAAMRNLLDQSVLRLETMARQLRAAQAASAEASQLAVASLAAVAAAESVGSGRSGAGQELVEAAREAQAAADAARNLCRGLQALITLGVGHRQVVESLVSSADPGPDNFEWMRHVRHYWDADADILFVAFAQTRLPYGWEYRGDMAEPVSLLLPGCQPHLLAAINALQTSPVVSLSLAGSQGSGQEAVKAMAALVGKFCVVADLGPDATPACCARLLVGVLASDSWLCLEGVERLNLQALSCLGQQLQAVWAAFFYGAPTVQLPAVSPQGQGQQVASPWARAAPADACTPASLFITAPLMAQLMPHHPVMR
ncbi:hypothetical protein QJQ45_021415, partial [Haematococcus lacustris]